MPFVTMAGGVDLRCRQYRSTPRAAPISSGSFERPHRVERKCQPHARVESMAISWRQRWVSRRLFCSSWSFLPGDALM